MAALPVLSFAFDEGEGNTFSSYHGSATGSGEGLFWRVGRHVGEGDNALTRESQVNGGQTAIVTNGLPAGVDAWSAFTVMLDVRPFSSHNGSQWATVFYSTTDGTSGDWLGLSVNTGGYLSAYIGGTSVPQPDNPLPFDQWSNIALVWNGTTATTYINGVVQKTASVSGGHAALLRLMLTGSAWDASGPAVDNFRLFDVPLTTGNILEYMGMRVGDEPDPEPLDTPVVSIVNATNPTEFGAENGTITVAWQSVPNADRYEVGIAEGTDVTAGFTTLSTNAVSPYEITGLAANPYTVAVRAHPVEGW